MQFFVRNSLNFENSKDFVESCKEEIFPCDIADIEDPEHRENLYKTFQALFAEAHSLKYAVFLESAVYKFLIYRLPASNTVNRSTRINWIDVSP